MWPENTEKDTFLHHSDLTVFCVIKYNGNQHPKEHKMGKLALGTHVFIDEGKI